MLELLNRHLNEINENLTVNGFIRMLWNTEENDLECFKIYCFDIKEKQEGRIYLLFKNKSKIKYVLNKIFLLEIFNEIKSNLKKIILKFRDNLF